MAVDHRGEGERVLERLVGAATEVGAHRVGRVADEDETVVGAGAQARCEQDALGVGPPTDGCEDLAGARVPVGEVAAGQGECLGRVHGGATATAHRAEPRGTLRSRRRAEETARPPPLGGGALGRSGQVPAQRDPVGDDRRRPRPGVLTDGRAHAVGAHDEVGPELGGEGPRVRDLLRQP